MFRAALPCFLAFLLAAACGNEPASAPPPTGPFNRIVSVTLGTDEMLIHLAEPSRIAALSIFPDDPLYSNIVEEAEAVGGRVAASAEQVLALRPDLVLYASYNNPDFVALIEAAGVTAHQVEGFDSLESILENLLLIGRMVGAEDKALKMKADATDLLHALPSVSSHPGVVYFDHGWIAGASTIQDEMIRLAGGVNYAAQQGIEGTQQISTEVLQTWNPDVILFVGRETKALDPAALPPEAAPLANLPAMRDGKAFEIPSRIFTSTSHYAARGPEILIPLLHPEFNQP